MSDHHTHGVGASPECALCPVCVLLQAFSTAQPEVTGHLLAAGRELSMAMAKAFEASASSFDRAATAHRERESSPSQPSAETDAAPTAPPRLQRVQLD